MAGEAFGLDPSTFDLDAWIDGTDRPETTVELSPHDLDYARRLAALEAQIPAAERITAENRGPNDPSPEALLAQMQELQAERAKTVLRVRVRQVTDVELAKATVAAKKSGVAEGDYYLWGLSVATVHPSYDGSLGADDIPPHFTPKQLKRLRDRDRSGEHMVAVLLAAANDLMRGPSVPSSPGR